MKNYWHDDIAEMMRRAAPVVPVTQDRAAQLPYPHYTDERWNTARLVYGREQRCANVNYSDRLWQWDYEAAERAAKAVKDARTAASIERWLSVYHGKTVILRYIMAGCNVSSGYPYWVYGYDFEEAAE